MCQLVNDLALNYPTAYVVRRSFSFHFFTLKHQDSGVGLLLFKLLRSLFEEIASKWKTLFFVQLFRISQILPTHAEYGHTRTHTHTTNEFNPFINPAAHALQVLHGAIAHSVPLHFYSFRFVNFIGLIVCCCCPAFVWSFAFYGPNGNRQKVWGISCVFGSRVKIATKRPASQPSKRVI